MCIALFAPGSPTPAPGSAGCVSLVAINGVGFLAVPGEAGGAMYMGSFSKYRRGWAVNAGWISFGRGVAGGRWKEGGRQMQKYT